MRRGPDWLRSGPRVLRALVALQILAIVVAGTATVLRFPVFSPIDERAHYDYVRSVAEDARLPVITDLVAGETLSVNDRVYPRPASPPARERGLGGQSYEAFQPPLYYVLAAPVFLLSGDYATKVELVRGLDLLLLLAAIPLLAALARRALPGNPLLALSAGLTVLLWPGVVVRSVTISNAALEIVAALGFLLLAWRADESGRTRDLVLAGAALGAAMLTKTTLIYLGVVFAWVLWRRLRRGSDRPALIAAVAVPAVMLAPWLAFNLDRYGSLTANAQARDQQAPVINPAGEEFGLGDVPGQAKELLSPLLPQEWDRQYDLAAIAWTEIGLVLALLGAVVIAATRGHRGGGVYLALPVALCAAMLLTILVGSDWDAVLPRYLYPVLPALALWAVAAWRRAVRERWLGAGVAAAAGATALVWLRLAGDYYFTDLGARLPV